MEVVRTNFKNKNYERAITLTKIIEPENADNMHN
jgi:hypothetical protein